jgi:hypothetical protein
MIPGPVWVQVSLQVGAGVRPQAPSGTRAPPGHSPHLLIHALTARIWVGAWLVPLL